MTPPAFDPDGNELNDCGWTGGLDDLRMFAAARLLLNNFDHIKAYWMIQGLKVCQVALDFGADDMDGTHGSTDEELIYHSAGTLYRASTWTIASSAASSSRPVNTSQCAETPPTTSSRLIGSPRTVKAGIVRTRPPHYVAMERADRVLAGRRLDAALRTDRLH